MNTELQKITMLMVLFTVVNAVTNAQIKIGLRPYVLDSAVLVEMESATKGFLPSRMTTAQRNAIASPAPGLLLFNTTTNRVEVNTGTTSAPVWYPMNPGNLDLVSNGTAAISLTNCSVKETGTLITAVPANGVLQTIEVMVTEPGTYYFIATSGNISFSASGIFTRTGLQKVELIGRGTTTSQGPLTFILNQASTCSFTRQVQ